MIGHTSDLNLRTRNLRAKASPIQTAGSKKPAFCLSHPLFFYRFRSVSVFYFISLQKILTKCKGKIK
jgi:hypothetical protein